MIRGVVIWTSFWVQRRRYLCKECDCGQINLIPSRSDDDAKNCRQQISPKRLLGHDWMNVGAGQLCKHEMNAISARPGRVHVGRQVRCGYVVHSSPAWNIIINSPAGKHWVILVSNLQTRLFHELVNDFRKNHSNVLIKSFQASEAGMFMTCYDGAVKQQIRFWAAGV